MKRVSDSGWLIKCRIGIWLTSALLAVEAGAAIREETFDREPANWEGVNNRSTAFEAKTVLQDFGYSPSTRHAGGRPGEVGGRINPAGEAAYYGYALPQRLSMDSVMSAEGRISVAPGADIFSSASSIPIR